MTLPRQEMNNTGYECYQTCTREYRIEMLTENYNRIAACFPTLHETDVFRGDRQNGLQLSKY